MGTDIHGVFQKKEGNTWKDIPSNYEYNRHYLLFAWLGNVRNGYGFAGVRTGDIVTPLSDNRGYPDGFITQEDNYFVTTDFNCIPDYVKEYTESNGDNELWMGDHSHSWVTAEEVINTKIGKVLRTGIISIEQYKEWDGENKPEYWCGGICGPDILVSNPSEIKAETTHVRIEWFDDLNNEFAYFIDEVKRLQKEHVEVRFVFGFDS